MSFLQRFFRKNNDEDYESVLAALALDIQKRETKLSEIRLRERRSTLLTTLYTLAAWATYVSLWYMNLIPTFSWKIEKAVKDALVIVGPIIILFTRRIVQIWYKRKGDAEDKTLRVLLKQQRLKVEEIKKKTNYYSTRNLIERYDDPSESSPLRRRGPAQPQPLTPQRQMPQTISAPVSPALKMQLSRAASTQSQPSPAPRKQWYDKLADALLGDDEQTPSQATSRYALICEKCFAHNGLVKESMWEDTQYICPKCGHLNVPARAKKGRGTSSSPFSHTPLSPASPLGSPLKPQTSQQRLPSLASALNQPAEVRRISPSQPTADSLGVEKGLSDGHEVVEGNSMRMVIDS